MQLRASCLLWAGDYSEPRRALAAATAVGEIPSQPQSLGLPPTNGLLNARVTHIRVTVAG